MWVMEDGGWLKYKSLYGEIRSLTFIWLNSFNVGIIYRIKTLEHSMVSFVLILESFNAIWGHLSEFESSVRYCVVNRDKVGNFSWFDDLNTLRKRVKFAHKKSIYLRYFSLKSQGRSCSFSLCNPLDYTFSFQRVNLTKCRNLTAKIEDLDAWRRKVAQFAVVTARPRLGTRSIVTWPVEGKKLLTLQTMPRTCAGQVSFCHEYCPICANH